MLEINEKHEIRNGKNELMAAELMADNDNFTLYDFCKKFKLGYGIVDINDTDPYNPADRYETFTFVAKNGQRFEFELSFDAGVTSDDAESLGIMDAIANEEFNAISDDIAKKMSVYTTGMYSYGERIRGAESIAVTDEDYNETGEYTFVPYPMD